MKRRGVLVAIACLFVLAVMGGQRRVSAEGSERHLLYVAVPGIRNEVKWGGIGILVFDMDHGHRLLRRIPTLPAEPGHEPEAMKGICASAKTGPHDQNARRRTTMKPIRQ